jgi:protein ImuA
VEARLDKDALWAMEEALRPEVAAAAVAGAVEGDLDLTMSRRLNLAAAGSGAPLILLRPPATAGTSAAATRWRVATAPAGRDRFGTFARCRWNLALERCRNGRPGHWLIEWDHVAHRFGLAEILANCAPSAGAGQDSRRLAG